MTTRIAAALTAITLGSTITLLGSADPAAATSATGATQIERALVREMNQARARHGRPPLRPRAALARPARGHSRYLLANGLFTHAGAGGAPFWLRLVAAGFPRNRTMAENIAQGPGCDARAAAQVVRAWMASRAHRANLLDRRLRFVGAGVASSADCGLTVVTADYGS